MTRHSIIKKTAPWLILCLAAATAMGTSYGEDYVKISRPAVDVKQVFTPGDLPQSDIPAFPGAEGAGKFSFGGRGGEVFVVTTLADSGPCSLREAVEASVPRPASFI